MEGPMYYTPIEVGLIALIVICLVLWIVILIEDVTRVMNRPDRRLTRAEFNNLLWLGAIGLVALAAYIVLREI
jgi:hypothetical protein